MLFHFQIQLIVDNIIRFGKLLILQILIEE